MKLFTRFFFCINRFFLYPVPSSLHFDSVISMLNNSIPFGSLRFFWLSTFVDCDTHSITVNVNVIPFWCVRLPLGMVSMCVQNKLAPYLATVSMSGELNCDKIVRLRCGWKKHSQRTKNNNKMRAKQTRPKKKKNGRAKWNSIQCWVGFPKCIEILVRTHTQPYYTCSLLSIKSNLSRLNFYNPRFDTALLTQIISVPLVFVLFTLCSI